MCKNDNHNGSIEIANIFVVNVAKVHHAQCYHVTALPDLLQAHSVKLPSKSCNSLG